MRNDEKLRIIFAKDPQDQSKWPGKEIEGTRETSYVFPVPKRVKHQKVYTAKAFHSFCRCIGVL